MDEDASMYSKRKSQLNVIFSVIGTPQDTDLAVLDDKSVRDIRSLKPRPASVSTYVHMK